MLAKDVFLQNHREYKELKLHLLLDSMFLVSQRCSYALVRFRHKKHLVRVQKTLWFGLKHYGFGQNKYN